MDLDTGLLRALVLLAEESHFGRAAGRLGITQQALSKRIHRLETVLAARLVDRVDRRHVHLTAAGQHALTAARDILSAVERLDAFHERSAGRIRVDVMGDHLAPSAWVRRAVVGSGLSLDAVHRPADTTAEHLLQTGGAQLSFGRSGAVPSPWPARIRRRLVLLEPLSVLLPAEHPWAQYDELPLERLAGQHLWFPMAAAPLEWRSYATELCSWAGITLNTTGSTFGYHQWAQDVARGLAPPSLIGEAMHLPDPRMRTVPLVEPTPVFPWSAHWHRGLDDEAVAAVLAAMGLSSGAPPLQPGVWMLPADAEALERDGAGL